MIKASISTFSLSELGCNTIEEVFSIIQRANFKFIDFKLDDYCRYFDWRELSKKEIYEHFFNIRKIAKNYGIEIFQTHAPYSSYPHYLEEGYAQKIIKSIVATAALGAKYCVCHPLPFPFSTNPNISQEEQQFNIKWYNQLQPILKQYKVVCCLENIYDWYNQEIRFIGFSNVRILKETVEILGSNFGVCLDTGHLNLYGGDLGETIKFLDDKLKVLHIHDNQGQIDEHCFPYNGNINWNNFADTLRCIGYTGTLNLELSPKYINSEEVLLKAKDIVNSISLNENRR